MKVLIAGGGIGGLTAALCCHHFGHEVTVFEQADVLGEVGAGIQIPPNAVKVFQALNCVDIIADKAVRAQAIETRMGESGLSLFSLPIDARLQARWGAPYLHIHRADYIDALCQVLHARAPGNVKLMSKIVSYEQTESEVTVKLADGQQVSGDVLIGADGIHSLVREQMLGPDMPVFTGTVAWRAVVPMDRLGRDAPSRTACAWMGKRRHAVTYQVRNGELANFVGVIEQDNWTGESWSQTGPREEVLQDFSGWHRTITLIIEQADTFYRWALFDRPPLQTWIEGRVALLGDAAHPMLPFMAQGAAMAVEDAWVLADELSKTERSLFARLGTYEDKRIQRTAKLQALSRRNAKTFHRQSLSGQLATYGPMWLAGRLAPGLIQSRLDDIYAYDVTEAVR